MCPKSVRTAAIVSQVFVVIWALLSFLAGVFQKDVIDFFSGGFFINTVKIVPVSMIILCFEGLLLSAANALMCKEKCVRAPLIMTAVSIGVFPVITAAARFIQLRYYAMNSIEVYQRLVIFNNASEELSNILSISAVITVAAAAVYAYARKNESAESDISEEMKNEYFRI